MLHVFINTMERRFGTNFIRAPYMYPEKKKKFLFLLIY